MKILLAKGIPLEKRLALSSPGQLGVGFRGMRERIAQIGGVLEVQSDENGTVVNATLPVEKGGATNSASEGQGPFSPEMRSPL
jgi:signal transduction histidine kinase